MTELVCPDCESPVEQEVRPPNVYYRCHSCGRLMKYGSLKHHDTDGDVFMSAAMSEALRVVAADENLFPIGEEQ